ncbi:Metal-dependent hydrolase [Sulfidibacter corallicola]|uniref:Metal-dependent hydrolase n=1 Tax=Sulfidibacter corallicola TaxID=2818388 RepID=A0A8A4TGN0_SULCO|nr:metal-dependent hydrolase [Sulfidibacter corallicola]QTD47878.1 metal-dependent hydrolase [Sulfidibacter corallicola]
MDSLTQMVLGAAVGEAVLGRKVGNKALIWGAVAGTLPDLDVLAYPFWNDVQRLTYHRSATHSFLVLAAFAPIMGLVIGRIHRRLDVNWVDWTKLCFWALITHPILDCFTTYGTQVFWPISPYPVSWSSVFIIDPLYSLPLLFSVALSFWLARESAQRRRVILFALAMSSSYLGITVFNKAAADKVFQEAVARDPNLGQGTMMSMPTAFNCVLWKALYIQDDRVYTAYYSFLGSEEDVTFSAKERGTHLIADMDQQPGVRRLQWFSKGYYHIYKEDNRVIFADLRFGEKDFYVFSYQIGTLEDERVLPAQIEKRPRPKPPSHYWEELWKRLKGEPVGAHPETSASHQPD